MNMKIGVFAAVATAIIYLSTPDTMTRMQTLLFLITIFGCSAYFIAWVIEEIESVKRKRRSLVIRQKKQRWQKVIDFRMHSNVKHIPAFPVRKDA